MVVYKMAAVCMGDNGSLDSEDLAERSTDPLCFSMVKKNGIKHNLFLSEKKCDSLESTVSKHEKMPRINGCNPKPILPAFTKPSAPTLRSRKDKISPEIPKRKRRASKQDISEPKEEIRAEEHREVREIKDIRDIKPFHFELAASSLKHEVPTLCDQTSVSTSCSEQVTPDTSRSCTPNPFLTPTALSIPSKDSQNCKHFKTKVEETPIKCNWKNCVSFLESSSMLEHIRQTHVDSQQQSETFVCLWQGCKVFNKPSCSMSWLSRHIVCHSGDKPFKCIVASCGQRFTSQGGLERHVNSHFNTLPQANQKTLKSREDTPTKIMRRKKNKRRRPQGTRTGDFFDNCIMARLQEELEDLTRRTNMDVLGPPHSVTFHSTVIAKRTEESGKIKVLLHWVPEDILPDSWVPESQVTDLAQRVIPLTQLPRSTSGNLHPALYRHHRFRKHRRK